MMLPKLSNIMKTDDITGARPKIFKSSKKLAAPNAHAIQSNIKIIS